MKIGVVKKVKRSILLRALGILIKQRQWESRYNTYNQQNKFHGNQWTKKVA